MPRRNIVEGFWRPVVPETGTTGGKHDCFSSLIKLVESAGNRLRPGFRTDFAAVKAEVAGYRDMEELLVRLNLQFRFQRDRSRGGDDAGLHLAIVTGCRGRFVVGRPGVAALHDETTVFDIIDRAAAQAE